MADSGLTPFGLRKESMIVTVIAHATSKKGKEKETQELLLGLLAPTRAEKGCLNYDLHQSSEKPEEFVFHENWSSEEALKTHLRSLHVLQAMRKAKDLLTEPVRITLWKKLDNIS